MYKACISVRSKNDNEILPLKEGLKIAFQTFLIANAIFYIFYYLLLNFVDPSLVDLQMENAQQLLEDYKDYLPPEQTKDMKETMNREGFEMTIGKTIYEYVKGAIVGFVFSFLIGAIVRQD